MALNTSWKSLSTHNISVLSRESLSLCVKDFKKENKNTEPQGGFIWLLLAFIVCLSFTPKSAFSHDGPSMLRFVISIPEPSAHYYCIELHGRGGNLDTLHLKMPNWMPGYYQIMNYAETIEEISAEDENRKELPLAKVNENTWIIHGIKNQSFVIKYKIRTQRQFVANSYVDQYHAYLVPGNSFLYADGFLDVPVEVQVLNHPDWEEIATGLETVMGKSNEFVASDFDMLYDCPILMGNLEELQPFKVRGVEHRFIGYRIGDFDKVQFTANLKEVVKAAVDIIGEIPYEDYTFIGIGPGYGGIEHLNNTTVSFDGNRLNSPEAMERMMGFLAHEYFHHYNVKRIRPLELGPFDYDKGSRTNLLWLSEGVTVFYESRILRRAGLIGEESLLADLTAQMTTLENDSGRFHQSLVQASYYTWEEGPFGSGGGGADRSISVYNKGAVIAMFLDLEIRNATKNKRSLDDVMRKLYGKYYIKEDRGFTDAEFQQVCEQVAGVSLNKLFEYVYTTKELDYDTYLSYAGLKVDTRIIESSDNTLKQQVLVFRDENPDALQIAILNSFLNE